MGIQKLSYGLTVSEKIETDKSYRIRSDELIAEPYVLRMKTNENISVPDTLHAKPMVDPRYLINRASAQIIDVHVKALILKI